ncbi:MAG: protein kinase [Planctomycetes bacterium]|nr:protein kinase [Planctomycetota bacterium]
MNERDIFLAAIEIADPAQRAAYVGQACGADAGLKAQVEALLNTHAQASQFLETPAADKDSVAQTIVTKSSGTDDDPGAERAPAEAEFRRYLQPATRPGWLGRLGHYEIEAILGRGAFGIVAKAFDEKLHRVVAIKLMNPELAATSPPRQRFLREARTAAAVTHENIVAIHAVEEEPIPYLVMEYIPGQTLQQRMDARGPFGAQEILRIGQQVAAGLAAAHGANLIHRDIKPSNILLTGGPAERAKISDFGLARAVDDATMTSSGLIAGTPMYMAPEQARGETLDHRADLFSLGSVLYQMASGRPPFRAANTVAVLKRVCEDTPRPLDDVLPGIPGWLETIIFNLLEKKRDDRYQTAQELADLLARCQSELQHQGQVTCVPGRPAAAETQDFSPAGSADRGAKRKPIGWLIGGVLAVAAVTGFALMNNGGKKTPDPNTTVPSNATAAPSPTAAPAVKPTEATGWQGWPADAPAPALAPFDAVQAKNHQEAWAKYLQIDVEYTNTLGMKFVLIPPGEFTMGSTAEEIAAALKEIDPIDKYWQERIKSEAPQHKVILTQPIYLGVNEVTQAEYEKVMGTNPSHFAPMGMGKEAVAGLQTGDHPVEMVSWNDAAEFCAKLSKQEKLKTFYFRAGMGIRLPRRDGHEVLDRRSGRRPGARGLVRWELGRSHACGRRVESESVRAVRHPRQCVGVGAGRVGCRLLRPIPGQTRGQPKQPIFRRFPACAPGRLLAQPRVPLSVVGSPCQRPDGPFQRSWLSGVVGGCGLACQSLTSLSLSSDLCLL